MHASMTLAERLLCLPPAVVLTALLPALAGCSSGPAGAGASNWSSSASAVTERGTKATDPSPGGPVIAWAPPPSEATDEDKKASGEMVGLFTGPCLAKFPDDAAVESYAASEKLAPMTEEQVRQLLGTDPGMGWIRQTDSGTYRLTIEKPP